MFCIKCFFSYLLYLYIKCIFVSILEVALRRLDFVKKTQTFHVINIVNQFKKLIRLFNYYWIIRIFENHLILDNLRNHAWKYIFNKRREHKMKLLKDLSYKLWKLAQVTSKFYQNLKKNFKLQRQSFFNFKVFKSLT